MGTYLSYKSVPGCEDQINRLFQAHSSDPDSFMVYSDKVIEKEIAWIHSPNGDSQDHMRSWLKTVKDWNTNFPAYCSGQGQIKLSGIDESDINLMSRIAFTVRVLVENPEKFELVSGLSNAKRLIHAQGKIKEILENKLQPFTSFLRAEFQNLGFEESFYF
ncbi:hypothetical protein [Eoetvoesiella caeni]